MHRKQGGVSEAPHWERSQTPSGPAGSWHCTPDSVQVSGGVPCNEPKSQATKPSNDPSRAAQRSMFREPETGLCVWGLMITSREGLTRCAPSCRPTDRASVANHGTSAVGPKPFSSSPDAITSRSKHAVIRPLQAVVRRPLGPDSLGAERGSLRTTRESNTTI